MEIYIYIHLPMCKHGCWNTVRSFVARCYTWHLHKCALGYDDVQSFFKRIAGSLVGRRVGRRKGGVEEESEVGEGGSRDGEKVVNKEGGEGTYRICHQYCFVYIKVKHKPRQSCLFGRRYRCKGSRGSHPLEHI